LRSYDVAIASLAIGAPRKWTDNVISQHTLPDVISERRGVARRITYPGLVRLALVRELQTELGIGIADALVVADNVLRQESGGVHRAGALTLRVDLEALERRLSRHLGDALESAPAPRRGRPPSRP
jgi:hypothetical protein